MTTDIQPCTHPSHHWVIDQPNGPTSNGVCEHCGQKRVFSNSGAGVGKDWNWKDTPQPEDVAPLQLSKAWWPKNQTANMDYYDSAGY